MKDTEHTSLEITPDLLLRAYAAGVFPMADAADAKEVFWVEPRRRGLIPLGSFHIPRSLRKRLRRSDHEVRIDADFDGVLAACADREETWINDQIRELYGALHRMGHAHSVEVWQDGQLAGGLYGVSIGAAFFGESMFSRARDTSKIALVHLVARLRVGGFTLLDTQFTTPHLERFGAITVSREVYRSLLVEALSTDANFYSIDADASPSRVIQEISQTS